MTTNILMCIIGVAFMTGGFYATGLRGGLTRSRGPYRPISKAGRVIVFLAGMAIFADGLEQLPGGTHLLGKGWRVAFAICTVLILAVVLDSRIVRDFMGRRRVNHPMIGIDFPNGLPSAMVAVRIAFFVAVAAMVMFGTLPMVNSIAEAGIIVCVLVLFAMGVLYGILEDHYVKRGRGTMQLTSQAEREAAPVRSQSVE